MEDADEHLVSAALMYCGSTTGLGCLRGRLSRASGLI